MARASAPGSNTSLAFVCITVWVAAAVAAGRLGIWLAIGGASIALGIAVLVLDGAAARQILRPSLRLGLLGAAAGALMTAATYALYPLLHRIAPPLAADTGRLYAAFRGPSLGVASLALGPIILGEELVWRGVVQGMFVRRFKPAVGVALTAAVYALAHAPIGSTALVLVALGCGLAWGVLRAATASLIPPLVAHLVWDAFVLLWLPLDSM